VMTKKKKKNPHESISQGHLVIGTYEKVKHSISTFF
jgi:hypothetical protein